MDIKKYVEEIDRLYDNIFSLKRDRDKILFIIKVLFIKYIIDNNYCKSTEDNIISLKRNFSINNIIFFWSGKKVSWFEEEKTIIKDNDWKFLKEFLLVKQVLTNYNSHIIGEVYESYLNLSTKKTKGAYYTPFRIINYLLSIEKNNFDINYKIIDPACGCGFFLSKTYDLLFANYSNDLSNKSSNSIEYHNNIISKQLFGIEKDDLSALLAKIILALKSNIFIENINIYTGDSLTEDFHHLNNTFDLVIGNPPYIGHKQTEKKYRLKLKEEYTNIFHDKSDISYCFFKRGMDFLKKNGKLIFVTSRYFIEAYNAKKLRQFLQNNTKINMIIDFYGTRIMKGIGVDPAIIVLTNNSKKDNEFVQIKKMKSNIENKDYNDIINDIKKENSEKYFSNFYILQRELNCEGWEFNDNISREIINKIKNSCKYSLEDICKSYQGIITGLDKAFVHDLEKVDKFNKKIIKPWIKSKDIIPFNIHTNKKILLYTDIIKNEDKYPNEIKYLTNYKDRLSQRREVKKGIRKWFHLQWGRCQEIFQSPKIIFPYKSNKNKFALDTKGYYFSADIYALILEDKLFNNYNYTFLVFLLNSKLYEFYFKSYAKKLGENLYEYYPNTLMRLKVPDIDNKYKEVFNKYDIILKEGINKHDNEMIKDLLIKVDIWFYKYFNLTDEEIKFIEDRV